MKFSLYSKKNVLDEMQEQTMSKIERRGFWLMWGGLLAAMVIQMMTSNLKFTGSAYSTSWNKLTSKKQPFAASIATAAAVMGPILPLGLLGLSVLGMSLFAKTSLITPFEILAKSMLKRSNK